MEKKKAVVSSLMLTLLVLTFIPSVFGASENWIEVLRFTGSGLSTETTETFVINHVDWRIHWTFESRIDPPPTVFMINVYDSKDKIVDLFMTAFEGNGRLNYNTTGSFYLKIRKNYVKNYEIIVEQNIDSIPEFPSMVFVPILFISSLIGLIIRTRLKRKINEKF